MTTEELLNKFYDFLDEKRVKAEFLGLFYERHRDTTFGAWAGETPPQRWVSGAFAWPQKTIELWIVIDDTWLGTLKTVQSMPKPENPRETARETEKSGTLETIYSDRFTEFLKKENSLDAYFYNFGFFNIGKGSWENWAKTVAPTDFLLKAFPWVSPPKKDKEHWILLNEKWKALLEKEEQTAPEDIYEQLSADELADRLEAFLLKRGMKDGFDYNLAKFGRENNSRPFIKRIEGIKPESIIGCAFNWSDTQEGFDFWAGLEFEWQKELMKAGLMEDWSKEEELETYPSKEAELKPGTEVIHKLTGKKHKIIFVSKIFIILTDPLVCAPDNETVTTIHIFKKEYSLPIFTPYILSEIAALNPFERKIKNLSTGIEFKIEGLLATGIMLENFKDMIRWEALCQHYIWVDNGLPVGKAVSP